MGDIFGQNSLAGIFDRKPYAFQMLGQSDSDIFSCLRVFERIIYQDSDQLPDLIFIGTYTDIVSNLIAVIYFFIISNAFAGTLPSICMLITGNFRHLSREMLYRD